MANERDEINDAKRVVIINPATGTPNNTAAGNQKVTLVRGDGTEFGFNPATSDALGTQVSLASTAYNLGYNGATWDRLRTKGTGWQGVALVRGSDGGEFLALGDSTPFNQVLQTANMNFNGASFERQRGNTEGTLLASAARTATTTSPIQTNYNARGANFFLNITANPGAAETLSIFVNEIEPVSGNGVTGATFVVPAATNGLYLLQMYPGLASAAMPDTRGVMRPGVLPRTYVVQVVHSAAGSWTYSLTYSLIV